MDQNDLKRQATTREQKLGFVFLLIFGLITVSLGVLQIRNSIYSPFFSTVAVNENVENTTPDEFAELKSTDTDHDGLFDYDELYVYNTSPYLPDTDSDGITDKKEIDNNTDPLCPQGQTCGASTIESSTAMPSSTSNITGSSLLGEGIAGMDALTSGENVSQSSDASASAAELQAVLKDPQKLREMLIATGKVTASALSQIDDKTLLEMVTQLMNEEPTTNTQTLPATSTVSNQ